MVRLAQSLFLGGWHSQPGVLGKLPELRSLSTSRGGWPMSVPGFTADRSLGKTGGAYQAAGGFNPSTGLALAFGSWCGVSCYQICSNDPKCLNFCLSLQRYCPQPPPPTNCCQSPACAACQCCDYYPCDPGIPNNPDPCCHSGVLHACLLCNRLANSTGCDRCCG